MYYLNKIVGWVASPMGALFIGLLFAWLFRRRFPRLAKCVGFAAVAFLWIMGCGVTTRLVGVPLERPYVSEGRPCGTIDEIPDAELIVLLGGGAGAHERCGASEFFQSSDRLRQAARLWHRYAERGRDIRISCTGGGVERSTVPALVEWQVPRDRIVFSEEPRNTAEEARHIREIGIRRIALVTSAWHMRRAAMLFRRQGLEVSPVPTDFEMTFAGECPVEIRDFFPSAEACMRNSAAIKEWVGILGYSILR